MLQGNLIWIALLTISSKKMITNLRTGHGEGFTFTNHSSNKRTHMIHTSGLSIEKPPIYDKSFDSTFLMKSPYREAEEASESSQTPNNTLSLSYSCQEAVWQPISKIRRACMQEVQWIKPLQYFPTVL